MEAPRRFLIDGNMILRSLKKDATGLEYSNMPTNIKAYTYAGNAIERLRTQLKNLLPGKL